MTRRLALGAALLVLATPARAQDLGHRFEAAPAALRARVGEPVELRLSVRLHEGDLITDSVPRPTGELPEGVRLLAIDKLQRRADRALVGRATVAFYRPGAQALPAFAIPFLRVSANLRGRIRSEPVTIEIVPTIPAGNPSVRDIKDLAPVKGVDWLPILVALGVVALSALAARVVRRRRSGGAGPLTVRPSDRPAVLPPDPYDVALAQLAALDPRDLPALADLLRRCLADAEAVPALERTTRELVGALPPHLAGKGSRARLRTLLGQADLVKFARAEPRPGAGAAFVAAARALLETWRGARPARVEPADAGR
ncbi:MAG TPA: hypothetical protein VFU46_13775 [Gemmatimonadales bacterium]|nr:hypothetical protein [Gemmatimonadales bacterium]